MVQLTITGDFTQNPCGGTMSSIKRDVKKKVLPRPDPRFLSRDPAHCSVIPLEKFGLLSILVSFSADGDAAVEF
jgi:hypothetical protein